MRIRSAFFWVGGAAAIVISAVVFSRPAFRQKQGTVAVRDPSRRLLGTPQPAKPFAVDDLPFALMSLSAYGVRGTSESKDGVPCTNMTAVLGKEWTMWPDFPGTELTTEISKVHLRPQVWESASGTIVVAFGGTASGQDWIANTHWFHPFIRDQYTVIEDTFAPAFAKELARRMQQNGPSHIGSVTLIATGHSLGAGLAEKFAYALPAIENGIPRVSKVYAFDPSPVTSFTSTMGKIRNENRRGLDIDRIYERGEILAILRSITSVVHKPPSSNPRVRQIRYNLFGNDRYGLTNSVGSHSIQKLSCGLGKIAAGAE